MNAAAPSVLAFPLACFRLRAWARGVLVDARAMTLAEAVDGLQEAAERSGLVDALGQDEVQAIMVAEFEAAPC